MNPLLTISAASNPGPDSLVGRWSEIVSHTDPKYGGLSSAVPSLAKAMTSATKMQITLEAFCARTEQTIPIGFPENDLRFWPPSRRAWFSANLRARFSDVLRGKNGVHIHGLWESSTAVGASTCRDLGIPYILSAHGMLEPWALRSGRVKKLLYSTLIEQRNVAGAACLHALTRDEAVQYRDFGVRSPIAVIPNGVTIPLQANSSSFFEHFPDLRAKRIILFLGRLHPKKGLDLLLQSWREIASSWPDAHLVLAGPDTQGTQSRLEALIQDNHLQHTVTFSGMSHGDDKWSALSAAECFVLPSHSEGFSISILEALGIGLPVIATEACHMPEIAENGCGWQISAGSNALTTALHEVLRNSRAQNKAIGRRGYELIRQRYSWLSIASQMANVYRWVEGGPLPDTVTMVGE